MRRVLFSIWLAVLFAESGWGAPKLGAVSYQFTDDSSKVSLGSDLVKNDSRENATGTLKMQLWACPAPYQGGSIQGHLIATTDRIQNLGPGQFYDNLRRTVAYTPPPAAATYHMVIVLLEYRGGKYVIADHVNMKNLKALAPLPLFSMKGPWRWQTSYEGGTVDMSVAKISHRRTGNTGTLKLSVWLTEAPYDGGRLYGYEIGSVRKDALKPGFGYNEVKNVAKFVPPPAGLYYANLILSEWSDDAYRVVAWIPGTSATQFQTPPAAP
jgi:hypothetical protein